MYKDKTPHKIFFDATADPLEAKIKRAMRMFKEATGQQANFCSVPHAAVPNGKPVIEGLTIFTTDLLSKHTIWLGIAHPGEN